MATTVKDDRFYETDQSSVIKCGKCWRDDLISTYRGRYTGDEAVYQSQLTELPRGEAYQCDECLAQSPEYEDLGDLP
jgi:hypothetical protein